MIELLLRYGFWHQRSSDFAEGCQVCCKTIAEKLSLLSIIHRLGPLLGTRPHFLSLLGKNGLSSSGCQLKLTDMGKKSHQSS